MQDKAEFAVIFCGIFALVGGLFMAIGIMIRKEGERKLQRCTSQTWGKVTRLIESRDSDGKRYYHPEFEYTVGDQTFVVESKYGSMPPKYAEGQNVRICFNPNDFRDYYAEGEEAPKFLSNVFTAVGAGALVIAVVAALLMYLL